MYYLIHFMPILLFVLCFVGSGIYFTMLGIPNAFYQLSSTTAILPAVALGWLLHKVNAQERMNAFLDGARHRDIITMCFIFVLAGAFTEITKSIGSVDATIQMALAFIPSQFLLIGIFLVSAFISLAIGSSMGTIATIAPIAAGLSAQTDFPTALSLATVVGGAMFGDNLSIVSDTTIAAVASQEASLKEKMKLNGKVALIASVITIVLLLLLGPSVKSSIEVGHYSLLLTAPYILLILCSFAGVNVFISLPVSILFAGLIGIFMVPDYTFLTFNKNMTVGFASMNEIMLLSLMIGGLSGLAGKEFSNELVKRLSAWITRRDAGARSAQLMIAALVSLFDLLLANNTIAIIFSGEIAREIAKRHHVPAAYSATWLDAFSCVFQGLIPYGAQLLLASSIAGISPLSIVPYVYYCYVLAIVALLHIMFVKPKL
jgi:Na+/H+ antiporter NhaC